MPPKAMRPRTSRRSSADLGVDDGERRLAAERAVRALEPSCSIERVMAPIVGELVGQRRRVDATVAEEHVFQCRLVHRLRHDGRSEGGQVAAVDRREAGQPPRSYWTARWNPHETGRESRTSKRRLTVVTVR